MNRTWCLRTGRAVFGGPRVLRRPFFGHFVARLSEAMHAHSIDRSLLPSFPQYISTQCPSSYTRLYLAAATPWSFHTTSTLIHQDLLDSSCVDANHRIQRPSTQSSRRIKFQTPQQQSRLESPSQPNSRVTWLKRQISPKYSKSIDDTLVQSPSID